MTEFSSTRNVKTGRKPYRCEHCDCWIEVGSPSVYICQKYDGEFVDYRSHPECDQLAKEVWGWLDNGRDEWMGLIGELAETDDSDDEHGFKKRLAEIQAKYRKWERPAKVTA